MSRPIFRLVITNKNNTKAKNYEAGVAFKNDFAGYNIVLSPGITISWQDEAYITLLPFDGDSRSGRNAETASDAPEF